MKKDRVLQYSLKDNEIVGFIYPVYTWGPPRIILDFLKRMKLVNYSYNYIFSVAVCGDNIGETMDVFSKALKKKGLALSCGFSMVMPNNYVISFDVDPAELERQKLSKAEERLAEINEIIMERKVDVFDLLKGPVPGFLTYVLSPLFWMFMPNTKKFHTTGGCTGCGLCEKVCSTGNISVDKTPVWGTNCTLCLACVHKCPVKAVQYGKSTLKRGRYVNPIYRK